MDERTIITKYRMLPQREKEQIIAIINKKEKLDTIEELKKMAIQFLRENKYNETIQVIEELKNIK